MIETLKQQNFTCTIVKRMEPSFHPAALKNNNYIVRPPLVTMQIQKLEHQCSSEPVNPYVEKLQVRFNNFCGELLTHSTAQPK